MPIQATTSEDRALMMALCERKLRNKNRKRRDNTKLPAGAPLYFNCKVCQEEIVLPEDYTPHPDLFLCEHCRKLKELELINTD